VTDDATSNQAPVMGAPELAIAEAPLAPDFDTLFETELDYVWNALRRLGVQEADLDDQVNEVFLRVHAQLTHYDAARPIRPWLFAFAVRVAAEHRRLARNHREIPGLPPDVPDPSPGADAHVEASERRALVLAALDALDEDQRAVFVALEIEGHSGPEVAEALGVSVNTVYSRQRLGREKFTTALRRLRTIGERP
jgi:RNA polymerase sigma-70 factor, ECF subfamily